MRAQLLRGTIPHRFSHPLKTTTGVGLVWVATGAIGRTLTRSVRDKRMWLCGITVVCACALASPVLAAEQDLSQRSDAELTARTAQWGELSATERRALLAEVRGRMNQAQVKAPTVRITRRYGRIVRKSDGSVVVQTTVVQPKQDQTQVSAQQPQVSVQQQAGRITFGFGFERRTRKRANAERVTPVTQEAAPAETDL